MILGRPTNLWLGLTTAVSGAIAGTLILFGHDPVLVGTAASLWQAVLGAGIALVAGGPPTLNPGDPYKIVTEGPQPNYQATVAKPPAPTVPTPDFEG